jgi:nitrous-oxide reductase
MFRTLQWRWFTAALVGAGITALTVAACQKSGTTGRPNVNGDAAQRVYVAPGEYDSYYAFLSGGHSGQVYVYGLPSGRHLMTIPVFTPESASGWGYDEDSKAMMGGYTWGDAHHPALSETNGDYDGRWLFINDLPHGRIARIDLDVFKTHQILGPIPNISANHASTFVTENTEYTFAASRFSAPVPNRYQSIDSYKNTFNGVIAAIAIAGDGTMSLDYEVLTPPFDWDLCDAGKGPSHGWVFFSCYNSEQAYTKLEVNASQNEQDYIAAMDWRKGKEAIAQGKFKVIAGAKVIDPKDVPGLIYLIPTPKSPHGVDIDPSGRYIVASGKLAAVVVVHSFEKLQEAIQKKDFAGEFGGIPVVRYEATKIAEVPVGLGPLHTQFDDKGNAYTSLFLDSAIAKWSLETFKVLDKVDVQYSIGHLAASEGDTKHPTGDWLLALNKISKDRYLPLGPTHPEGAQLIDLRAPKMQVILDIPTYMEPHYGQIIKADKIMNRVKLIYPIQDNKNPYRALNESETSVERKGKEVHVKMIAIRTHFYPDTLTVKTGDTVYFHVTNLEQDRDIAHGFAILGSNIDFQVEPGETKTAKWLAEKPGIYPFYCSNFCSALHQEMQGYLAVKP